MKVTGRILFAFVVYLLCLRAEVLSRQFAIDSGVNDIEDISRELFIWKAADTTVAPFVCPGSGNYPVPGQECTNAYYSCGSGNPVLSYCPGASVFEPTTLICTSSSNAPCKNITNTTTTTTTETTPWTTLETSTESTLDTEPPTTDNHDQSTTESTSVSTIKSTTTVNSTVSTVTTQKSTTETTTVNSTEYIPFVCPGSTPNGIYPNPNNCKTFYLCSNGIAYLYDCPSNLVFNPATGNCDYGENVSGPCGSTH
uniref:Chitin-binding type-2 domain-containing protein n=1 Tax=Daphnia galeata TaxID=27404 RepID=A0A8J2RM12_9CRUS|nr:unnamed protein product [Daphnia galeata]